MNRIRTTAVAVLSTAALTIPVATHASAAAPEPCQRQETQVQKAEDALARVTAVFNRQKTRVAEARHDVAAADTRSEKAQAKKALHAAKVKKEHVAKEKKAQQMRLAKANQRLSDCQAAHSGTQG